MRVQAQITLLVILSVCAISVNAQKVAVNEKNVSGADASNTSTARFEELRAAGFEALYNLDYETARKNFKELARLFPDHPAGPQFLAATLWTQTLNESRRLQSSLYNTDSFYAQKEDTPDPRLPSGKVSLSIGSAARAGRARAR